MTETSYIREYDAIITKYEGIEAEINERYDDLRDEIEAKTITLLYTQADKDAELEANEAARQAELSSMEDDKAAEISQFQEDYKTNMDRAQYLKTVPIDYDYLDEKIENLDFTVSQTEYEEDILEEMKDVMAALPYTVNNTKYMYLTLNDKCDALKNLADEEYAAYEEDYDEITERYAALRAAIEAKQITENYTQADKDAELQANEAAKNAEIAPINADYLGKSGAIAVALTNLKTDKETGFIGDVHINGKLHVDTNLNIEGNLNNIPIGNYITSNDLTQITTDISNLQTGKANTNHNHDTAYAAINHNHNNDYATINHNHNNDYATINHTHTTFNNSLSISSSQASGELRTLESYNPSMSENTKSMICFGKSYSPRQCGFIGFVYNSSNPYVEIGMHSLGNASLKVYNNSTTSAGTITAPAININNTSASSLWMNLLSVLNGNLANGHNLSIYFGKHLSNYNCGQLTFTPNGENSNVHIDIFGFGNLLNIYKNKVESSNPIIGSNVLANNETRLSAVETLISNKADDSMLTALAARVAIVETGKADTTHNHDSSYAAINHNHDTAYAAINHNHDSTYVKKTDIVATTPTPQENLTFISTTSNDYTTTITGTTAEITVSTSLFSSLSTLSLLFEFLDDDRETYYISYDLSQGTEDIGNNLNHFSVSTERNNNIVSYTVHSDRDVIDLNYFDVFIYANNAESRLRYKYVRETIDIYSLNTNTTEGQVIANLAPKATTKNVSNTQIINFQQINQEIIVESITTDFSVMGFVILTKGYSLENIVIQLERNNNTVCNINVGTSDKVFDLITISDYIDFKIDFSEYFTQSAAGYSVNVIYGSNVDYAYNVASFDVSYGGYLKGIQTSDNDKLLTQGEIIDLIHPIGSIYTSFVPVPPSKLFPNTQWTQITDRFLYCADSSGTTGGSETHTHTTGNHTLTVDEMPSHSHSITHYDNDSSVSVGHYQHTWWTANWKSVSTGNAGGNQPHNHGDTGSASNLPPYITIYAWYRTA